MTSAMDLGLTGADIWQLEKSLRTIQLYKTSWVVEADIRSFFDHVSHDWLMKMLEHDSMDCLKRFRLLIHAFVLICTIDNCY